LRVGWGYTITSSSTESGSRRSEQRLRLRET
jgi:hypothetical protein